jgi:hypothetical protein
MSIKAKLRVQLLADTVLVAESEDEALWRGVLAAIQNGHSHPELAGPPEAAMPSPPSSASAASPSASSRGNPAPEVLDGDDAIGRLARDLGLPAHEVQGACGPERDAPFLRLDVKSWEVFKKAYAGRGRHSISSAVVAATLLCLWFKHSGIGRRPTQKEAHDVLAELGERDVNASRSIKNCEWLQTRPDGLLVNPAKFSAATALARAFVLGTSVQGGG